MVIRVFLILWVDGLLPLTEARQSVVGMVRDGQLLLQRNHSLGTDGIYSRETMTELFT